MSHIHWSMPPVRTTAVSGWSVVSDSLIPSDIMRGDTFAFQLRYATLAFPTWACKASPGWEAFLNTCHVFYIVSFLFIEISKSRYLKTGRQRTSENPGRLRKNTLNENYMCQEDIERCVVLSIHFLRIPPLPAHKVVASMNLMGGQSRSQETKASWKWTTMDWLYAIKRRCSRIATKAPISPPGQRCK